MPVALRRICLLLCVAGFAVRPTLLHAQLRLSPKQADSLLADVHEALVAYHPYAYRDGGRARLDSFFARELRARPRDHPETDSLSVSEVLRRVAPVNELLGDGHFQLSPKRTARYRELTKTHRYSFPVRGPYAGRYLLTDTLDLADGTRLPPGTEALRLDGRAVDSLVAATVVLVGLDDHGNTASQLAVGARLLPGFYQREVGFRDSLTLTVLEPTEGAQPRRVTLYPTSPDSTAQKTRVRKRVAAERRMRELISLEFLEGGRVAELDIRTFSGGAYKRVNQYKHVRRLFEQVDSAGVEGLIIDVRGNTGGALDLVEHVLSFVLDSTFVTQEVAIAYHRRGAGSTGFKRWRNRALGGVKAQGNDVYRATRMYDSTEPAKPERRYAGPLAVLVDESSFSGATTLANAVQQLGRGLVVGQVPGGSAERMYAGMLFKVPVGPRKRWELNMPLYYMDMLGDARGNLRPDILVPREAADVIAGRDAAREIAAEALLLSGD